MSKGEIKGTSLGFSHNDLNGDGKIDTMKLTLSFKGDPAMIRKVRITGTVDY